MDHQPQFPRYVIVSPVKDEERCIELTLRSVTDQTLQPVLWIIVDDGSRDRTADIVRRYADRHPFIRLLSSREAGRRLLGSAEARAFEIGYASVIDVPHDFVVKLDGDLSFGPDYFDRLLHHFATDPRLGIASGVYLEADAAGKWRPVVMPPYHAFGACKVVRKRCFDEIGGFLTSPGWDTVDEIRALMGGWRTTHFDDLQVKHHKREGSAAGSLPTHLFHGQIYYATGGDPLFLVLKVLRRMLAPPFVIGALALAAGYLASVIAGKPRVVTREEARYYRRLLRRRLFVEPERVGA
jgi:glycosyltransferase involved in cell wall biosynthesis